MRGIPSDGRCRAGPPICLGRASDACVLGVGVIDRAGNARYLAWGVRNARLGKSILPEPIEAVGAQLGISHRVHDVTVAEVVLQRAGVDAVVGELEAAAVAQRVRMSRERARSRSLDHRVGTGGQSNVRANQFPRSVS